MLFTKSPQSRHEVGRWSPSQKLYLHLCLQLKVRSIILILYCRCNLQYYLSDLHASVCLHVYIVSVQCCGITSTVEQLLLSLLSDVVEAMTRVWKTESTKKIHCVCLVGR